MIIDPNTFERFNAVLTGVIVPRPIAFVSTMSPDGEVNLAPYSFSTPCHMTMSFSLHPATSAIRAKTPSETSKRPDNLWSTSLSTPSPTR